MKMPAAMLILVLLTPLALRAAQPRLVSISPPEPWGEVVSWTNGMTNGYCHLEFTWDIKAPWYSLWINLPITNSLMAQDTWFGGPVFAPNVRAVVREFSSGRIDFSRMFYRIVNSSTRRPFPSDWVTNTVRVSNASSEAVSNLVLGVDCYCCDDLPLGRLGQGVTTDDFAFVVWNPVVWDYDLGSVEDPCTAFRLEYDIAGQHEQALLPLQLYILPGEVVWITISNTTATLDVMGDP